MPEPSLMVRDKKQRVKGREESMVGAKGVMERLAEAKREFLEAAKPLHYLMDEVWHRAPSEAEVVRRDLLELYQDFRVDPLLQEDLDAWMELVDPEGKVVFRAPDGGWEAIEVLTDYGKDDEHPLAVSMVIRYGSEEEVEVHLVWRPEEDRFELIQAHASFPEEGVEGPYLPRRIYERFLKGELPPPF